MTNCQDRRVRAVTAGVSRTAPPQTAWQLSPGQWFCGILVMVQPRETAREQIQKALNIQLKNQQTCFAACLNRAFNCVLSVLSRKLPRLRHVT